MSAAISRSNRGIIIQYDFCTGCHACEVACKKERGLEAGQFGIKVMEYGPAKKPDGRWDYFFLPAPTDLCNLCEERVEAGSFRHASTTARRRSWNTATWKSLPRR